MFSALALVNVPFVTVHKFISRIGLAIMNCIRIKAPGEPPACLEFLEQHPIPKVPKGGALVKCTGTRERTVAIMNCIRIKAPGEPPACLEFLEQHPIPEVPKGGALVKILYSGVCHTDLHLMSGFFKLTEDKVLKFEDRPGFGYPRIAGHEIAGTLYSMGADADSSTLKLGDRVLVYPWIHCNNCRPCKNGFNTSCDGSPQINIGMSEDGGFAEYVAVPDVRYAIPFPASIPLPVACLLPCSGLAAFSAVETAVDFVKEITDIKGRCSMLVIGAGGLGQWGLRFARALFPPNTSIMCTDVKQAALDTVSKNVESVTPLLLALDQPTDKIAQDFKKASDGGFDLVLDFAGTNKTFGVAKSTLRMRGQYVAIGLMGGEARFPITEMVLSTLTLKGNQVGSLNQLKRLLELVDKTPSLYANLQYNVHPLADGIEVIGKLAKGQVTGRAVLKCGGGEDGHQ